MLSASGTSKPVRERENKGGRIRKLEAATDMNYVYLSQKKATEKLYCGKSSWAVTARPPGRQAKARRSSEKWSVSNMQRSRVVK
jgi:hypothetical protein